MAGRRSPRRPAARDRSAGWLLVQRAVGIGRLPAGTNFPCWTVAVLEATGAPAGPAVTIRLVGWSESRRLNVTFRGKVGATNVLAFPAADRTGELGDLVICLPLVRREAEVQRKRPVAHLAHMVVHGMLHLLGHDHGKAAAARRMERLERRVLRQLGFPDPYGDPGRVVQAIKSRRRIQKT